MSKKIKIVLGLVGATIGILLIIVAVKVGSALAEPRQFRSKYTAKEKECGTKPVLVKLSRNSFESNSKVAIAVSPDNARYEQVIRDYENLKNPGPALMSLLFGQDAIVGMTCTLDEAKLIDIPLGTTYVDDPQNGIKAAQQATLSNFKNMVYVPKPVPEGYKISQFTFPADGSYYNFVYSKSSETSTRPSPAFSLMCLKGQIGKSLIDGQYTARPVIQRNVFYTLSGLKSKYPTYFWTQQTTPYTEDEGLTLLEQAKTDYVIQVDTGLICLFRSGTHKIPETAALIDSIGPVTDFNPDNYNTQITANIISK